MRILPSIEIKAAAETPASSVPVQAQDAGRFDALERLAKAIAQRLHALEQKVDNLQTPAHPAGAAAPILRAVEAPSSPPALAKIMVDPEALKRGLLDKMWKYLNDGQ